MNFEQWQIEIKNNLEIIADYARQKMQEPAEITKPDIKRFFEMVKQLDLMYENIKEVKQ